MNSIRYKFKIFLYQLVTFFIKWGFIFLVSALYNIETFDTMMLVLLLILDLISPNGLKSKLLKAIIAFAIWYFLLPLLKNGIIQNPSFITWSKVIIVSILILISQLVEFATFQNFIGDTNE